MHSSSKLTGMSHCSPATLVGHIQQSYYDERSPQCCQPCSTPINKEKEEKKIQGSSLILTFSPIRVRRSRVVVQALKRRT